MSRPGRRVDGLPREGMGPEPIRAALASWPRSREQNRYVARAQVECDRRPDGTGDEQADRADRVRWGRKVRSVGDLLARQYCLLDPGGRTKAPFLPPRNVFQLDRPRCHASPGGREWPTHRMDRPENKSDQGFVLLSLVPPLLPFRVGQRRSLNQEWSGLPSTAEGRAQLGAALRRSPAPHNRNASSSRDPQLEEPGDQFLGCES